MTIDEFIDLVRSKDNPKLAEQHGMVTQLWQDGEITVQKCGDLLWQRNLHMVEWSIPGAHELGLVFPHTLGKNSYIFCTQEDAAMLREGIRDLTMTMIKRMP